MDGPDRRFPTARGLYEGAANGGDIDGRRPYGEFVERRPFLATRISRRFGGFPIDGSISRFFTARRLNRGPTTPHTHPPNPYKRVVFAEMRP